MAKRIREDHKEFRDIISGRIRQSLKKFITSGKIFRARGKNGKITINIPRIDMPHIVFGEPEEGVGRGEGKDGDVIDKQPEPGKGNQAGQGHADGILVNVDMEEILKAIKEELKLPNMKPKLNQTFEEIKIRYNNISKVGPRSLLHRRRTLKEAIKQMIASGKWDQKNLVPGFREPIRVIEVQKDNLRYRQWNEIKIPSSNAVIFFARDGSGSMDAFKCEIVSDMCWWIDLWIRSFYKKVERCYVWHDTEAKTVSEEAFYKERYGGGTTCSTALTHIAKQLKNRYPPSKWNIYIFYFSDGENWPSDNKTFVDTINQKLNPSIVNMIGMTQVWAWRYEGSLKHYLDQKVGDNTLDGNFIRTTAIGQRDDQPQKNYGWYYRTGERTDKDDEEIRQAIIDLLGVGKNVAGQLAQSMAINV